LETGRVGAAGVLQGEVHHIRVHARECLLLLLAHLRPETVPKRREAHTLMPLPRQRSCQTVANEEQDAELAGDQGQEVERVLTSLAIVTVYALVLVGVFYFAVQRDWRLSKLVSEPPTTKEIVGLLTLDQNTLLTLSQRFIFLERMVYWLNGWNVFNQYPWLGVGIGNAGFFFPRFAPAMGWATFEIRNILYYLNQLPNVKSFWFRLLAETGIIGFSVFITWIYVLFQSARSSLRSQDPAMKTLALAGSLSLLAFIGEGFSIDSFAMPYMWVMAGLIAAIAMIYRREVEKDKLAAFIEPSQEER